MAAEKLPSFQFPQWNELVREAAPALSPPQEIGCYTTGPGRDTYHHTFIDDRTGLRQLRRKGPSGVSARNVRMDLSQGYETWIDRENPDDVSQKEHLEQIHNWILAHPHEYLQEKPTTDFVSFRGRLSNEIMCTPYDSNAGWIICAVSIDGVIFLTEFDTEEEAAYRKNAKEPALKGSYGGYKFEQHMTTDPADSEALKEFVNNFNAFYSVIKVKLDNFGLMFGAEIDCADSEIGNPQAPGCYVELKTNYALNSENAARTFYDKKMLRVWTQCYVSGVPLVVVGYKDRQGFVTHTEEIKIDDVTNKPHRLQTWRPDVCLKFLHHVLGFIRNTVVLDHTKALYKFQLYPRKTEITAEKYKPDSCYKFVPEWYLNERPQ